MRHHPEDKVVAYDPLVAEGRYRELGVEKADTPPDLYAVSDFITLHLASTPETRGFVAEKAFAAMKKSIPEIQDFEWGTNVSPEGKDQGFTHCFLVTFRDKAGLEVYLPHPEHKKFGAMLKGLIDKVLVIDYVAKSE